MKNQFYKKKIMWSTTMVYKKFSRSFGVVAALFAVLLFSACQETKEQPQTFAGEALGTTYHIKFFSSEKWDTQKGIDSVFEAVNKSMSTYIPTSDLSRINKGDTSVIVDQMFKDVFYLSEDIYKKTQGYFDPTVGDLVNAYGFGAEKMEVKKDSATIDSLMQYVGLNKISIDSEGRVKKTNPNVYLEFNAIGKGYAVDRVGAYLENHGVENYLLEVGGELLTKGSNLSSDQEWRVGIDDPKQKETDRVITTIIRLKDRGMATSGNYRKFNYDSITGEKYVHTVNPTTGFTEKTSLISTSVLAKDCATADAYATAFMAMGFKKARAIAAEVEGVEVYLIYDDQGESKSYATPGFEKEIVSTEDEEVN